MRYISGFFINSSEPIVPLFTQLLQNKKAVPGESFKLLNIHDGFSYIFYTPGNYKYNSSAFSIAAEYFLLDNFIETVAGALKKNGNKYTMYGIIFSYLSSYFVVKKYSNNTFDGRALINDMGEKIILKDGAAPLYICKTLSSENEDKQEEDRDFFNLTYFLDELGLSWKEFETLNHRCLEEGKLIWPETIIQGKIEDDDAYGDYPILPMFDYLVD